MVVGDQWRNDPRFDLLPVTEPGTPMGVTLEQSYQRTLEPRPGPGTMVPKMLTVLGLGWLLWLVWSTSGHIVRWRLLRSQKSDIRNQIWQAAKALLAKKRLTSDFRLLRR